MFDKLLYIFFLYCMPVLPYFSLVRYWLYNFFHSNHPLWSSIFVILCKYRSNFLQTTQSSGNYGFQETVYFRWHYLLQIAEIKDFSLRISHSHPPCYICKYCVFEKDLTAWLTLWKVYMNMSLYQVLQGKYMQQHLIKLIS